MALTPEQRAELEALGPNLVRQKLLDAGATFLPQPSRKYCQPRASGHNGAR